MKFLVLLLCALTINGCSIITVADTAIDVAMLPVKVGVAVVDAAIPDNDDDD